MTQAILIMPSVPAIQHRSARALERLLDIAIHSTSDILTFLQGIARSDVILVHHELECHGARTLVHWFRQLELEQPVIIVDMPDDRSTIVDFYEAGATSFLLKDDDASTARSTIENALDGISRLDGQITATLIQRLATLRQQVDAEDAVSRDAPPLLHLDIAAGM